MSLYKIFWRTCALLLLMCSCRNTDVEVADDQFSMHIRTAEARSPKDELAGFHLPEGFKIQLFVSEPNIGKPMNMAFDDQGRMWVTHSVEYPFADSSGIGRDKISILEDTDGDGRADLIVDFADSLNIPIGLVTVPNGVITYSIPNIYYLADHNGDDLVDERRILFSGFGYADTHGMINNMVRSWDGWIHADHGFANTSKVTGTNSDTLVMVSGNTFRFKQDGSHVEFTTTGRVNPYGYAFDEYGYTYSVDCHTSPIYQLIRGADYPHFSKQATGIGFGPAMMRHDYGATALAGLEYYLAPEFPPEYQQSFYYGDVVKSRVYRSTIKMNGTTPVHHQEPDFIISDDPWFRPVDVKMGPDGALYVADFYNRIIGHYEVALDHPERDRSRGRIWRITGPGVDDMKPQTDISTMNLTELLSHLSHPNLIFRMSVSDQIVDRFGQQAIESLINMVENDGTDWKTCVQAMWMLHRLEALPTDFIEQGLLNPNEFIQVHTLRILFDKGKVNESLLPEVRKLLNHENPHVQRQAVMVISQNPDYTHVPVLLRLYAQHTDTEDTHLFYSIRQALRDQLREESVLGKVIKSKWRPYDINALSDVLLGVYHPTSAEFLLDHLHALFEYDQNLINIIKHISRNVDPAKLTLLAERLENSILDIDLGYQSYQAMEQGLQQRGLSMSGSALEWGKELSKNILDGYLLEDKLWKVHPNEHMPFNRNPWQFIPLTDDDGNLQSKALSSGPMGEGAYVSAIVSPEFIFSSVLKFRFLGHKDISQPSNKGIPPVNRIELRHVESDSVLLSQYVAGPEFDTTLQWDLPAYYGEKVQLHLIDASPGWGEFIAIADINGNQVEIPEVDPNSWAERLHFAIDFGQKNNVLSLSPQLHAVMLGDDADFQVRGRAAEAMFSIQPEATLSSVQSLLGAAESTPLLKAEIARALSMARIEGKYELLREAIEFLSYQSQKEVLLNLLDAPEGAAFTLDCIESILISPRLSTDRQIIQKLNETMDASQRERFQTLVKNIKSPQENIQAVIDRRISGLYSSNTSLQAGERIFRQQCSTCHRLGNSGSDIAPQLDGIGNWGSRALTEKLFDPNRNISKAFVTYDIELANGRSVNGLLLRQEGESMVFANVTGQEFMVSNSEIIELTKSPFTLMPDNFLDILNEQDYYDLMEFLLRQK